ncbi:MAG: fumarate hydratase [Candidatus Syntropharchaeia archaeon]
MIEEKIIKDVAIELLRRAVTQLPKDVKDALRRGYEKEEEEVPRMQLEAILKNIELAEKRRRPICQDTGIPIFYVGIGNVEIGNIEREIIEGVKEATKLIPLRPNVVDPLSRSNSGTNIGRGIPSINYRMIDGNYIEIAVLPKGAGSENVSTLRMLDPSQGIRGIKEFVLETVLNAGGRPCPPVIVGIGIGGSADISMKLAKEALLRPIDQRNLHEKIAEMEKEITDALNETGIGPMGLGGKTTVLGVNIEYAYCHTASLPVGINIQCWAARRASARVYPDRVEYL